MSDNKLPIGFSMSIAQNKDALNYFAKLDEYTQNKIVSYIQNSTTGIEAKEKINKSVNCLGKNNIDFLN